MIKNCVMDDTPVFNNCICTSSLQIFKSYLCKFTALQYLPEMITPLTVYIKTTELALTTRIET
jgi:hypothetical protein